LNPKKIERNLALILAGSLLIRIGGEIQLMYLLKTSTNPPLSYISSGRFVSSGQWIHKKRNIDSFVIIVGLEGTVYMEQNGEQYEVIPGSTLILLPHTTHLGYKVSYGDASYYWCHFYSPEPYQITQIKSVAELPSLLNKLIYQSDEYNFVLIPIYSLYEDIDSIGILFHQLLHVSNTDCYTQYGMDYLLTLIMIDLTQQNILKYLQPLKKTEKDKRFEEILEWIRINVATGISVSRISDRFNYNPDYLSRVFKQKTGMNLQEYIHDIKVSKAKAMLINSNDTVKEIAYNLGFNDEKYFMKLFKEHENLTPTQFRNAFCHTHLNDH